MKRVNGVALYTFSAEQKGADPETLTGFILIRPDLEKTRFRIRHVDQGGSLEKESALIGLPAEHSPAFWKAYATHAADLREVLMSHTLSLPRIQTCHWRVDHILSCAGIRGVNELSANISLQLTNGDKTAFTLSAEKLRVLLEESRSPRPFFERKEGRRTVGRTLS